VTTWRQSLAKVAVPVRKLHGMTAGGSPEEERRATSLAGGTEPSLADWLDQRATGAWTRRAPVHPVVVQVHREKISSLPKDALNDLFDLAAEAEAEKRPGIFLEAGCARGGSAIVLAQAKHPSRPLHVHDVFGIIPPPTKQDGPKGQKRYRLIKSGGARGLGGTAYYGYENDLMDQVRDTFARFDLEVESNNVRLVPGLFQDTIAGDERVALAHIDGDWYDSVRTCLDRVGPRLVSGGVMAIDDYHFWSGCRKAVDDFLAEHPGEYRTALRTRLHVIKLGRLERWRAHSMRVLRSRRRTAKARIRSLYRRLR